MKWRERAGAFPWVVALSLMWCLAPTPLSAQDACDLSPPDVCYGDGSDGSWTVPPGTVLDGDKNYENLHVPPGVTVDTAGYVVRVCGTLLNEGIITDLHSGGTCVDPPGGRGQDPCQDSDPVGPPEAEEGSCTCACNAALYPEAGAGGTCGRGGGGGGGAGKLGDPCYDADGGDGGHGGDGGKGGGYVRIHAFILDNQGTIHADGQPGSPGESGDNGGYWVARDGRCRDFAGGGGGGGAGGRGGNGGTVKLYYSELVNLNLPDIHAAGGTGALGDAGGLSGTTTHGGPLECDDWPEESGDGAPGGCHGDPVVWCGGDGGDGAWEEGTYAENGEPGDPGPDGVPGQVITGSAAACCLDGGQTCVEVDPGCCADLGGTEALCGDHCLGDHNGNGIDDACEPCEACCLPDDTCEVITPTECVARFGAPQGPGSTCGGLWSCCNEEGECREIDLICCDEWENSVPGSTEACEAGSCPPRPVCGNNIREGTEKCDGTDDENCPGECLEDCTCPQPLCLGSWLAAPLNTAEETTCLEAHLTLCGPDWAPTFPGTDPPDDVIWYNYHDYKEPRCASQWDTAYPSHSQVADDFVLLDDANVTGVRWVGGHYWNPGYGYVDGLPTAFNILFYADEGDKPTGGPGDPSGTALVSYTIPIESMDVTRLNDWPSPVYIYEYEADIPEFLAAGGTKYWIAIQAVDDILPQWGIAASADLRQLALARQGFPALGVDYWEGSLDDDRAFQLMGYYTGFQECGNNIRETWEECDGTDDVLCPGACFPPGDPQECMCPYIPCNVDCPAYGIPGETEPCDDDPATEENAGCLFEAPGPYPAEVTLQCGVTVCGTAWNADGVGRDIDQYNVTIPEDQYMTFTFQAEFPACCGLLIYQEGLEGSGDCNDTSGYWTPHATPKCTERSWTEDCLPAGTYFLLIMVNPDQDQRFPCDSVYDENDYYITLDCEPCTILDCPDNSLFEQPAQDGDSDYWFATASDEALGLTWYEDFEDVYGDVCDIHFWGLMHDFEAGEDCIESPMTFEIRFFQDDAVTQIGATYTLPIVPVDTYQEYDPDPGTPGDEMTLWEFSADLAPCVPLNTGNPPGENQIGSGWVSIQALGTDDCLFYWAAADACDGGSRLWDEDEGAFCDNLVDLSLCLTGDEGLVLGACCYEPTGDCFEGEMVSCSGSGYRFEPYTLCAELDPPCGEIEGACCDLATGRCTYETQTDCLAGGGDFTAYGTCYPNTCPQPDPCDGPTVIYEQTPYDTDPDAMPFSYRNYGEVGIITAADVVFTCPIAITDFHWWAADGDCFNWTGLADVLMYADAGGSPQADPSHTRYNVPSYRAYYNGETVCDGELEVVIYTIILEGDEFPYINLTAGTYWIGMRPVGMLYDWSAMMVTSGAVGEPYRQKWEDEDAWISEDPNDTDIAFCLTYIGSASPPDGTVDARIPHVITSSVPCYGFGMPDNPATGVDESLQYPIVIDVGTAGADAGCWALCETPDMSASPCGSNDIAGVTDNGDGTYTIALAHGVAAGTVTTIQYNGLSYVSYIHHPANVNANYAGSLLSNANDINEIVDCLNSGDCENYEADIDASGIQGANDIIEEVNLLNGAGAYCPWVNTLLPENNGDCP